MYCNLNIIIYGIENKSIQWGNKLKVSYVQDPKYLDTSLKIINSFLVKIFKSSFGVYRFYQSSSKTTNAICLVVFKSILQFLMILPLILAYFGQIYRIDQEFKLITQKSIQTNATRHIQIIFQIKILFN
ncbi:unnamed protein product [Paramecium pentaurelia]|uniref:Transmembrane protein n=1 Tax=Paramecium pentaurelia TaxID=43138 RepID=A0A8S1VSQ7_9CILI|nr:unnamed protein product [Paramecium pentaurelia]